MLGSEGYHGNLEIRLQIIHNIMMQFSQRAFAGAALVISLLTGLLLPLLASVPTVEGLKDGLARTPQMGWVGNSSQQLVIALADSCRIRGIHSTVTFRRKLYFPWPT